MPFEVNSNVNAIEIAKYTKRKVKRIFKGQSERHGMIQYCPVYTRVVPKVMSNFFFLHANCE